MTDSQDEQNEAREEEARTDALAASHDEEGELDAIGVEPGRAPGDEGPHPESDLEADSEGEPNAKPTDWEEAERPPTGAWAKAPEGEPEGEPEGTGYVDAEGQVDGKYPVAHVVDTEEDQTVSMCGEKIEGDLLGNRVLAYTCTACQTAVTERKNELADALLDITSRLSVARSALSMVGIEENFSGWTDRVERALGKAAREMLRQVQSGPR